MCAGAERVRAQFGHKSFSARPGAHKSLILNGEMSEWSIEHAWKTISASVTERHRHTSWRSRFNGLRRQGVPRCESVNVGIRRRFRPHLTQFLHGSRFHLFVYAVMLFGTLRSR